MKIDQNTSASPDVLERSAVPLKFPQFRNAAALAHLAHTERGPRYVLVGGKAWYDAKDIREWLELNKRHGPPRASRVAEPDLNRATQSCSSAKRGRPTKFEQMKRRIGLVAAAADG